MNPFIIPLLLVAGTAGVTYLFDPASGRMRRSAVGDRVSRLTSRAKERTQKVREDISDRTQRFAKQARSRWRDEIATDEAVCRRARAAVREAVSEPQAVGVSVSEGRVFIHGEIPAQEHEPLLHAVREVSGVKEVTDRLTEREGKAARSNGATQASGWKRHVDLRQEHWTPPARLLSALIGGALIRTAARRPSALSVLAGVAGGTLLARSAFNKPITRMGRGDGVVDVHRSLVIDAPLERVFSLFDSVENFPCFLRNVREVRRQDNGRTHWVVKGPAGATVEWDSLTTVRQPNEVLAWHSVPGTKPEHSGVIRFERVGDNQTRVDFSMNYRPPAGAMGHALARVLGADSELDAHLAQMKRVAESWDSLRASIDGGGTIAADTPRASRSRRAGGTSLALNTSGV